MGRKWADIERMNVLVVSGDESLLARAREAYAEMGHLVLPAATAEQAMALMDGRDLALGNFILLDLDGFAEATVIALLNYLPVKEPREGGNFHWKTTTILLIGKDASSASISAEILRAKGHGGVCRKIFDKKEGWQNFWCDVYLPDEYRSPPKSFARNLIEQMIAGLRAQFGNSKRSDSDTE